MASIYNIMKDLRGDIIRDSKLLTEVQLQTLEEMFDSAVEDMPEEYHENIVALIERTLSKMDPLLLAAKRAELSRG